MVIDSNTMIALLLFVIGLALLFTAFFTKRGNKIIPGGQIGAALVGVLLLIPGFFYGIMPLMPSEEEVPTGTGQTVVVTTPSTTVPAPTFTVNTYSNGSANVYDNTTAESLSGSKFTTPFKAGTTNHTDIFCTSATVEHATTETTEEFTDPIYNFSVTPVAPTGASATDLVTLKFSAVDPGKCITSSGTDYRLISQDSDSDPYLYWKCVDASSGAVLCDWTATSGSATFLYTDNVYLWLMVVYSDEGMSYIDPYKSESITATLSNVDGSWSQSYSMVAYCIGTV